MTVIAERDEARKELARSEQTIDAQDAILTAKYNEQLSRARDAERERDEARQRLERLLDSSADGSWMARALDAERERDEALAKYQFMVHCAANEKLDGYRELASRLAAMEADRDEWRQQHENAR